jgi:CMP-N-acetylneuraminic acid synthetase
MSTEEAVLAVVIGRAGSRGLPGKNSIELAGRPMVCHSIETARSAVTVDRIVVSTDGEAIAAAAEAMSVPVVRRPPELASDTAPVGAAVRHAVANFWSESGDCDSGRGGIIVVLYANVPVRPPGLIDRAVKLLVRTGADSVQSYACVGRHHPHWMVALGEDDRVTPLVENTIDRRQDLPRLFIPDGGVIAVTRSSLMSADPDGAPHAFLGADRRGLENLPGEVIDVDTAHDLAVAEAMLRRSVAGVV